MKDGRQVAMLTHGQSFGETVLYNAVGKRTATVITRSYCQLILLEKAAMDAAFQSRPLVYQKLKEKAKVLYEAHLARCRRPQMSQSLILANVSMSLNTIEDNRVVERALEGLESGPELDSQNGDVQYRCTDSPISEQQPMAAGLNKPVQRQSRCGNA
jgi:CRP-like cAMP-binding protein